MYERKVFRQLSSKKLSRSSPGSIRKREYLKLLPFPEIDLAMPKEIEKEIILDAIGKFILSCDSEETEDFVREVKETIDSSCIGIIGTDNICQK